MKVCYEFAERNGYKVIGEYIDRALSGTGGNILLGYDIDEEKRYVVNEGEATIVRRIYEMYLAGSTMAQIIRYLNENGVKTSRGNEYSKNSIRRILTNKKYVGVYIYKGAEVAGGIPRIIDDATFADVQVLMAKNKKAPARAKAVEENYLLTTKLFCGLCQSAMTGVSGRSHTGALHQYYQCVTNRRHRNCKKKTVKKAYIEDLAVNETIRVLTPENIDKIARSVE